jgi:hypothetical protein
VLEQRSAERLPEAVTDSLVDPGVSP